MGGSSMLSQRYMGLSARCRLAVAFGGVMCGHLQMISADEERRARKGGRRGNGSWHKDVKWKELNKTAWIRGSLKYTTGWYAFY